MLLHPAEVCTMLRESPPACIVATLDALLSSDRLTGFITDVSAEFAAVLYCLRDLHASSAAPDACLASLFDLYTHAGAETRERQVVATLLQPLCAAANPDTVYELMWCFHGVTREHAADPPLVFLDAFCRATMHRLCAVTFLEVAAVAHVVPILAELLRVHLFCRSPALAWMAGDVLWRALEDPSVNADFCRTLTMYDVAAVRMAHTYADVVPRTMKAFFKRLTLVECVTRA